ncbi:MAG TPA: HEAT repeat domain-containing protein [Pirellulaceae bacterium]|nr:HEAT repeat domain-containing protein [Pirellulaceae bacterium]
MHYPGLLTRFAIGCTLLSCVPTNGHADNFILKTGAQVRGEWLNRDEAASLFYLVATEHGGRLRLERSRVAKVVPQTESQLKYDRLAPAVADTIEDHWMLAQWCRDHELLEQREQHLRRVIELDPDHVLARRALGYSEIGGQWVKKEEHLARQGYIRYKGKWRLPQEIDLAERRQSEELAKKDWYVKLSRWRSQLNGEKRHAALENIRQVRDPLAIEAIGRLLHVERDRRMRLTYVEVLGQIADNQASAALVELALSDRDDEVYYACVGQLAARMTPPLTRQFVLALKSPENGHVNRSAIALGSLGDQSVIPPLIDALVTRRNTVLPGSEMISTTFAKGGLMNQSGGAYTSGPTSPQVITQTAANQEVLKTLVKLSGVSFGFDQRAWRNWYTLEERRKRSPEATTRRID